MTDDPLAPMEVRQIAAIGLEDGDPLRVERDRWPLVLQTLTFQRLTDVIEEYGSSNAGPPRSLFTRPERFDAWLPKWRARLAEEACQLASGFSWKRALDVALREYDALLAAPAT